MELEDKARATLQEILDVVKGYREAVEASEQEASRLRVQCEAWRSRALEEQRRVSRLRRMMETITKSSGSSYIPPLHQGTRQGSTSDTFAYQFGTVLALTVALSGPSTAGTSGAAVAAAGAAGTTADSSRSMAAAAAAGAAAITALTAGPRPRSRSDVYLARTSGSLLDRPVGRSPRATATSGDGDAEAVVGAGSGGGSGGGGGLPHAMSSTGSLSSLGVAPSSSSASTRGHGRAGFKLVLKGGNGDSASLRQLSTYGAMFPNGVASSGGSSRSGKAGSGGLSGVHESYSACELVSAGSGAGSGSASGSGSGSGAAGGLGRPVGTSGTSGGRSGGLAGRPQSASSATLDGGVTLSPQPGPGSGRLSPVFREPAGRSPTAGPSPPPQGFHNVSPGAVLPPRPSALRGAGGSPGAAGRKPAARSPGWLQQSRPESPPPEQVPSPPAMAPFLPLAQQPTTPPQPQQLAPAGPPGQPDVAGCLGSTLAGSWPAHAVAGPDTAGASGRRSDEDDARAAPATPGAACTTVGEYDEEQRRHEHTDQDGDAIAAATTEPGQGAVPAAAVVAEAPPPSSETHTAPAVPAMPAPAMASLGPAASCPPAAAAPTRPHQLGTDTASVIAAARASSLATQLAADLAFTHLHRFSPGGFQPMASASGPVGRTQSAGFARSPVTPMAALAPASFSTGGASVPRRETVPASLLPHSAASAPGSGGGGGSLHPSSNLEELSWHAGSLHKQRTKLQDDLHSIQQSSNLIRCNRAKCNLALASPPPAAAAAGAAATPATAAGAAPARRATATAPATGPHALSPFGSEVALTAAAGGHDGPDVGARGDGWQHAAAAASSPAAGAAVSYLPQRAFSGPAPSRASPPRPVKADEDAAATPAGAAPRPLHRIASVSTHEPTGAAEPPVTDGTAPGPEPAPLDVAAPDDATAAVSSHHVATASTVGPDGPAPDPRPYPTAGGEPAAGAGAVVSDPSCQTCQGISLEPAFVALYWVTRPAAALVIAKPSPAVRPTFTAVLSWLQKRGVATYVEPSMMKGWLGLSCQLQPSQKRGRRLGGARSSRSSGGNGDSNSGSGSGSNSSPNSSSERKWGRCSGEGGEQERGTLHAEEAGATEGMAEVSDGPDIEEDEEYDDFHMPGCSTGVPQLLSWPADDGDDCHSQMVPPDVAAAVDFVVVLGGDGTVLWTCHIFGNQSVPPVVPFNMGSLGFLTPFDPAKVEEVLADVMEGGFPIMLRHRLHCHIVRAACGEARATGGAPAAAAAADGVGGGAGGGGECPREWVVLNEVVIDRGISSFLTNLECYCDGAFVTHVQGDGLIVATPTGSTAYNLAAGGSMVHPQVPGILFTPICPHSLSFRPLIFPDHVSLCVQVPANSRAQMWCSFDGKDRQALNAGDAVVIRMSAWPVATVCSRDASRDWFSGVREGLHWNMRRLQAGAGQ